ncbi:MAG TPA: 6-pyruvoyl tetrahydropterin synthase family protein [Methanomassiliicoccaceae archaeon]|jgi:6-pyruvoyltetrahydropterin/6-carboxytetrahydropterin synthase|nr:6-pyruvoyl tetrahydropterin synthase family protein [Euryarchaeota archaeon]HOB38816.1 6-pyruvoyl tetrahydropterin synthase family protein [Methanomassiliicoccaceae archaeon]HOK27881.1 6-pyruvoyl tetrahydropterin synthase family protein [Methanomassiliicoccaceae archaeon]HOQ25182.1 6-pyruvoyl tetrahydropterin synthase family protein [Methanomassiliicoccaceae archaeon]HQA21278.1 6-pyruvoyl tetrahydropterin synthase family protein [Methanomassiliicoccaceae archaeon]
MRIAIDGNYSGIRFSASHFIPGHDKCGRLHGHSYVLHLALHGDMGDNGMIMDFVDLKKALKDLVEELDHRVLLPGRSPLVQIRQGSEVEVLASGKRYVFPREDVVIMDVAQCSAEAMAGLILERLIDVIEFTPNVHMIEVGLDEERGQTAWASKELRP